MRVKRRSRQGQRSVSLVVLAVLGGCSLAGFLGMRSVVAQDERKLLGG